MDAPDDTTELTRLRLALEALRDGSRRLAPADEMDVLRRAVLLASNTLELKSPLRQPSSTLAGSRDHESN